MVSDSNKIDDNDYKFGDVYVHGDWASLYTQDGVRGTWRIHVAGFKGEAEGVAKELWDEDEKEKASLDGHHYGTGLLLGKGRPEDVTKVQELLAHAKAESQLSS